MHETADLADVIVPADSGALAALSRSLAAAPKQRTGVVVLRGAVDPLDDAPRIAAMKMVAAIRPQPAAQEIRAFHRDAYGVAPLSLESDAQGVAATWAIAKALTAGATVVLQKVDAFHFGWHRLARAFEGATAQPVQVNLYATAGETDGLSWHRDPHDVLVIQLCGKKHFSLAADLAGGQPADEEEVVLGPGDLLWMRRGTPHAVRSASTGSLHGSIGLLHYVRERDGKLRRAHDAVEPSCSPGHPALLKRSDVWPTMRALLTWRPLRPLPTDAQTAGLLRPDLLLLAYRQQLFAGDTPMPLSGDHWRQLKAGSVPRSLAGASLLEGGPRPARHLADLMAFLRTENNSGS